MTSIAIILLMILKFLWWVVIIHAVMSWLINFDVINLRQRFVYTIWSTLNRLTEPLYRPIRSVLPSMGGLDLAPLVLIFAILALQVLISNNLMGAAYY
ncbi:YggT family protein [uncultured Albimonas sp.]|uniref:YggT family protein n=1 Tax=uncultured Albimonas sp. TaxID=1331701 RepID=UPI0030EE262D